MSNAMRAAVGTMLAAVSFGTIHVGMGAAQDLPSFGVISGQSLTNTGPTTIVGNIAISPGTSYTGSGSVTHIGDTFLGDSVASRIQSDLTTLYTALEGRPTSAGGDLTGQDLGGLTLSAGVYNFDTSAGLATGQTLTLDGGGNPDAVFIFNIGTTLTAGSGSRVLLQNGAQGGNVFYRVGSSATLDTSADLEGQIVALTSITMNTSASIRCGAVHARNGSVTLDTNTIQICALSGQGFDTAALNPSLSQNQTSVAQALSDYVANGGTLPIGLAILAATQTPAELAASLSQLTGEVSTGVAPMGMQAMDGFLDIVMRSGRTSRTPVAAPRDEGVPFGMVREKINEVYTGKYGSDPDDGGETLSYPDNLTPSRVWDVWASGYGSRSTSEGDPGLGHHGRTATTKGLAAGLNVAPGDGTNYGLALSWNKADFALDDRLGAGSSETVLLALRGRTSSDRGYLEGALAYGRGDIATSRTVTLAGVDRFSARTKATTLAAHVEAGYHMGSFTPFAGLRVQSFKTPAYSETTVSGSSSYALRYDAETTTSVRSELGVDAQWSKDVGHGAATFGVRAAWAHEFARHRPTTRSFLTLPDAAFAVSGTTQDRDSLILAASVGLAAANGFSIQGGMNLDYAGTAVDYGGSLTAAYSW